MEPRSVFLLGCLLLARRDFGVGEEVVGQLEDQLGDVGGAGDETTLPVSRTLLLLHLLKQKLANKFQGFELVTTQPPFTGCICVPYYLCSVNNTIINDGAGVIDIRYRRCTGDLEVCCYLRVVVPPTVPPTVPSTIPTTRPPPMTIPTTAPPPMTIPTTRPPPMTIPTTPPPTTVPTTRPPPMTIPTTPPPTTIPTTRPPPMTIPTTPPPMTIPTTPFTIPTTPFTIPTTASPITAAPLYCICVPIYQCSVYGGVVGVDGTGIINPRQQLASTCTGVFVCCSYTPGVVQLPAPAPVQPIATFPPFVLPTVQTATVVIPQQSVVLQLPPIVLGQSCVCMLVNLCNTGYIPISGMGTFDPRLILGRQGQPPGTCNAANNMCCKLTQNSVSAPSLTNSVTNSLAASSLVGTVAAGDIKNPGTPNACTCVPMAQCAEGNAVTYDGIGAIDPRFGPCMSPTHVCCRLQNQRRNEQLANLALPSLENRVFLNPSAIVVGQQVQCGTRDTTYAGTTQTSAGNAYFAEFPWMALLLIRKPGAADVFQCGGSLINSRTVLTAAHCVVSCDPGTLVARLGEWDTQSTSEPLPFQEVSALSIVVHPQFYAGALYHDVALVILARPATYAANVRPVCMPAQGQVFAAGTLCYASGWGRSAFGAGGEYQTTLRKVDLPIVDNVNCQTRLRQTRLGPSFQLHSSFICAGGEVSKDTCYKDGGGPLVCQDSTGRFTQAGIISWGIGCGDNTPAVYASVAQHRQWIDQQLLAYGIYN